MFKGQATMLSTALFLALAVPATAQITPDPATPDEQPRSEDCLLPPDDGVAEAEPDGETVPAVPDDESKPPETDSLTEKLDPCNGVLQPPPTGDAEIAEPPPDTGVTPIIPPGELPEQPPSQE